MESLKKQTAKLLGEQKKYRRWLAVFLCLAADGFAVFTAAEHGGEALRRACSTKSNFHIRITEQGENFRPVL